MSGWPQPGDWRRAEQREQLQVGQVVVVHIYHGAHYGYVEKIGRTRVQVLVQMRTHRSARLRSFAITDVWISRAASAPKGRREQRVSRKQRWVRTP